MGRTAIDLRRVFYRALETAKRREADGDPGYVQYFLDTQRQYDSMRELVMEAEIELTTGKVERALEAVRMQLLQ